ncbi:hypothetical protein NR798_10175 [Archangium gephyra]|uniref:hypothetical protein n=1 Tax=Archangium gephyra TaxID=48 RepID=UPI0035D48A79
MAVTDVELVRLTVQLRVRLPLLEQPPDHTAVRPLLTVSVTDVPVGKAMLPVLPTFTRSPLGDEVMDSPGWSSG